MARSKQVGPLGGVRVLEFTHQWAGPLAGRLLADLGADVVKVESIQRPDSVRYAAYPNNEPGERPWNRGGYFHKNNRNKRGITLDLSHDKGRELFLALVERSDIVLNNYAPRVMDNLGLDYGTLRQAREDIIVIAMPGYGSAGPHRDWVAFGTTIQGMSGLASVTGYAEGPPMLMGVAFPDAVAGISAAVAALAALHHRRRSGKGQFIDLSQQEAALRILGPSFIDHSFNHRLPPRRGNAHPSMAPHGAYRCQGEDAWVTIAVRSDEEWRRFCTLLGQEDLAGDPRFSNSAARLRHRGEADAVVEGWTRQHPPEQVMQALQAAGIAAGVVMTNRELLEDHHLKERRFLVTVNHPETGPHPYIGMPFKLSATPLTVRRPAPSLGEHNEEILMGMLGLRREDLAELERTKVIGKAPGA